MLAIYDWFGYELPVKERYRAIKEAGFDGVLLWWSNAFGRDSFGKDVTECYLQCIADCAEFEIPTMVVHMPDDSDMYNILLVDRIKKIAEKAERSGINVALENLCDYNSLEYILEKVDSQRIGLCYDCGHHHRYCPSIDLLSKYGSRLMALHLHDNEGRHTHRLPFDGILDWSSIMQSVAKTGYSGAIAIEAMNWGYENLSVKEFLYKAFEAAKRLEELSSGS